MEHTHICYVITAEVSGRGRISQSQCTFSCFVIGLFRLLLLVTPTTQFSLDRKRQSRKPNQVFLGTKRQFLRFVKL